MDDEEIFTFGYDAADGFVFGCRLRQ